MMSWLPAGHDHVVVLGQSFINHRRDLAAGAHAADLMPIRTLTVDVSLLASVRALVEAGTNFGQVSGVTQAVGVLPSQGPLETILKADVYGTTLLLEEWQCHRSRGSGVRPPRLSPEIVFRRSHEQIGCHARDYAWRGKSLRVVRRASVGENVAHE